MKSNNWLVKASPLLQKLPDYRREDLVSDATAGLIVAIMLVPQAMAYAMLAGLPPQIGLYASILPLVLYSFFGSSNSLAVGPVALISLLVVTGLRELAEIGSLEFHGYCLALALMVGLNQIAMAAFRLGFLVNFISRPVLVGFTSAAAIVIAASQLTHLFGISFDKTEYPIEMIWQTLKAIPEFQPATVIVGLASIILLLSFNYTLSPLLTRFNMAKSVAEAIGKLGPLLVVVLASILVSAFQLHESSNVSIVGETPAGFPTLTLPTINFDHFRRLFALSLLITFVGYLESISIANTLASRRREKVDANRELFALGVADIGAAFSGGYPVSGGFSRSIVNFNSGAKTPAAGLITAALIAISVAFLTPAFFYIPKTVLAAIILVAVAGLVDFETPIKLWRYSRTDAFAWTITFLIVLGVGVEAGILIGITSTVVMLMWKMSRPHVAEVGRMKDGSGFRNILRHDVEAAPGVLAIRLDESINFANANFLESYLLEQVSDRPEIRNVLLICSGVNDVDATGLQALEFVQRELDEVGVGFYLSDVKGPVTDRFKLANQNSTFLTDQVFMTAEQALDHLADKSIGSDRPLQSAHLLADH